MSRYRLLIGEKRDVWPETTRGRISLTCFLLLIAGLAVLGLHNSYVGLGDALKQIRDAYPAGRMEFAVLVGLTLIAYTAGILLVNMGFHSRVHEWLHEAGYRISGVLPERITRTKNYVLVSGDLTFRQFLLGVAAPQTLTAGLILLTCAGWQSAWGLIPFITLLVAVGGSSSDYGLLLWAIRQKHNTTFFLEDGHFVSK